MFGKPSAPAIAIITSHCSSSRTFHILPLANAHEFTHANQPSLMLVFVCIRTPALAAETSARKSRFSHTSAVALPLHATATLDLLVSNVALGLCLSTCYLPSVDLSQR